jgi:hypothetical protein
MIYFSLAKQELKCLRMTRENPTVMLALETLECSLKKLRIRIIVIIGSRLILSLSDRVGYMLKTWHL